MTGISGKNNSNQSSSELTVVLFDSTSSLKELRDLIIQKIPSVIITFGYESHKILLENKIQHQTSDHYLTEHDLQTIQKHSYRISEWFNASQIDNLLNYDGVNLGQLYQVEFHYLLVPFLKKFVELTKIFEVYRSAKFVTSQTLYTIIQSFTNSVTRFKKDNKNSSEFLYDFVKTSLRIGNKHIDINLSRSTYLRLKKTSEKIIRLLFKPKIHSTNTKSVLLVEFDPVRYSKFFAMMPRTAINFICYNRRRPTIWNYESFLTIRKSGCGIATYYDIVDKSLENSIRERILQIQPKLDFLWKEQFFATFFSINGHSFWEILKPAFIELGKKRILEAIQEIELTKHLLKKHKISSVLVWSEIGFNEQIIIKLATSFNIPIILIQHGLYYDTQEAYEFNRLGGIFPFYSTKFVAWGKMLRQYVINNGISSEKIETLGSPQMDKIFDKKTDNSKNKFVLLATSSPVNNLVNDLTVKTREKYEEAIKIICKVVSKMNKKLVIKLHPFSEELDISKLAKEIDPKITVVKERSFLSLVRSCEVLITIDLSTTILEAQILEKPVISISVKDYGFGVPQVFSSNSCIQTDIANLENILKRILEDNAFRQNIVDNANRFIDNYLSNQGRASEELLSFLEKL